MIQSLQETATKKEIDYEASGNQWLEDDGNFVLGWPIFIYFQGLC